MATITYTAKRGIVPGHIAGLDYSVLFGLRTYKQKIKAKRDEHRSLSGVTKRFLHSEDNEYAITTNALIKSEADKVFEFLRSTSGAESFIFDRYATELDVGGEPVAVRPVTCELVDDDFSYDRVDQTDYFRLSFTIREKAITSIYTEDYYFDLDFTRGENPNPEFFTYVGNASVPMYTMLNDGKYWPLDDDRPRSHWDHINGRELGAWFGGPVTNLALYSSDFSNPSWTTLNGTKAAANSIFSTNGVAQKITATGAVTEVMQTFGTFTGSPETFYAVLESGNSTKLSAAITDATTSTQLSRVEVDTTTGLVTTLTGGTGRAIKLMDVGPNGGSVWIVATTVTGTSGNTRRMRLLPKDTTSATAYGFVHHAQMTADVARNIISPPIVTTSSSVTRGPNLFSCTQLPTWFNQREYTIGTEAALIDITNASGTESRYFVSVNDGSSGEYSALWSWSGSLAWRLKAVDGGVTQCDVAQFSTWVVGQHKAAARVKLNGFAIATDGNTPTIDSAGVMPTVTQINIGASNSGGYADAYISRVMIKPIAMTNDELQAWTV